MTAKLGKRYRDTITGFEGTATGRFEYLHGCVRINLTGALNGEPKDFAFDEPQLEEVDTKKRLAKVGPGGPGPLLRGRDCRRDRADVSSVGRLSAIPRDVPLVDCGRHRGGRPDGVLDLREAGMVSDQIKVTFSGEWVCDIPTFYGDNPPEDLPIPAELAKEMRGYGSLVTVLDDWNIADQVIVHVNGERVW